MKNNLPKTLSILLSFVLVAYLFSLYLPDLIEKHSLKVPPAYKKLDNVQGVSISSESGKVKYPQDYTIVLLGDSMTETLGNADELRGYLNEYYPDKTFEVLNYGYGSTNITSGRERLTGTTYHANRDFRPILDIDYDFLIIESFGHNPLSQYSGEEGIKQQNKVLDDMYSLLASESAREKIIFMSTIGTDKITYAKNSQKDLSPEVRKQWAQERDSYLENHLSQAKFYGLRSIDVYHASLDSQGNVKDYLVRDDDNIHPSPSGTLFISKKIADFFHDNNLIQ